MTKDNEKLPEEKKKKEVKTKEQEPITEKKKEETTIQEVNSSETVKKEKNKLPIVIFLVILGILIISIGGYFIVTTVLDSFEQKTEEKEDKKDTNEKDTTNKEDSEEKEESKKEEEKKEDKKRYQPLKTYSIDEFNAIGYALVSTKEKEEDGYETQKYYIIDKNLQVVKELDHYINLDSFYNVEIKDNKVIATNILGDTIYTSKENEYKEARLIKDHYLVLTRQIDTYNSSVTESGLYDLETKKIVVEPSEKYYRHVADCGDNMIALDANKTELFNTKLNKIITFEDDILFYSSTFTNGYSTHYYYGKEDNVIIAKDTGEVIKITNPYDPYLNGLSFKNHKNNYFFENNSHVSYILDVNNKKITSIGKDFYNVKNDPLFNKNGYALILFENQGGAKYYTVINGKGEKQFNPIRIDAQGEETVKSNNLTENGYYIVTKDNIDIVMNYKHEVILKAETGEKFTSIEEDLIKVEKITKEEENSSEEKETYFKDIKGIKINVEIEKAK